MQPRPKKEVAAKRDGMLMEFSIIAAVLVVIVLAAVNATSVTASINCKAPLVSAMCKAFQR